MLFFKQGLQHIWQTPSCSELSPPLKPSHSVTMRCPDCKSAQVCPTGSMQTHNALHKGNLKALAKKKIKKKKLCEVMLGRRKKTASNSDNSLSYNTLLVVSIWFPTAKIVKVIRLLIWIYCNDRKMLNFLFGTDRLRYETAQSYWRKKQKDNTVLKTNPSIHPDIYYNLLCA